jgi:hypothetical protein
VKCQFFELVKPDFIPGRSTRHKCRPFRHRMPLPNSSRTSHAYLYWYRTKWGTIAEQGKILVEYAYYLALVVTRAPAASYLKSWVRLPAEANFSGFKGVCAFKGRWRSHRQRSVCGDFVNLEDLHSVFKDAPRNRICTCVFIGMNVHALWVSQMYCVLRKVSSCFYNSVLQTMGTGLSLGTPAYQTSITQFHGHTRPTVKMETCKRNTRSSLALHTISTMGKT